MQSVAGDEHHVEICAVEQVKIKCILKVNGDCVNLNVYKGFYYRNNLFSILALSLFTLAANSYIFKTTTKKVNLILDSRFYRKVTGKYSLER